MAVHILVLLYITSWKTWNLSNHACKFWGKWNRNVFRHPWGYGLSSKDVSDEALREKGHVMWITSFYCRPSRAKRCVECAFGMLTAKWRLLNKATETKVSNTEMIARCISLLHNIIIDTEETTHDPSVHHESYTNSCIPSGQNNCQRWIIESALKRSSRSKICFKLHITGPTGATLSQNQYVYVRWMFSVAPHYGTYV